MQYSLNFCLEIELHLAFLWWERARSIEWNTYIRIFGSSKSSKKKCFLVFTSPVAPSPAPSPLPPIMFLCSCFETNQNLRKRASRSLLYEGGFDGENDLTKTPLNVQACLHFALQPDQWSSRSLTLIYGLLLFFSLRPSFGAHSSRKPESPWMSVARVFFREILGHECFPISIVTFGTMITFITWSSRQFNIK